MAASTTRPAALPSATRLWAALGALAVSALALAALRVVVQQRVSAQPERLNVYPQPDKLIGAALQRAAYRAPALLPIYGSSELTQPQANRADEFFSGQPTGFGAFFIGNPGETSLIIATKLAAAGPDATGKKAVVFLSPGWFLVPELDHPGFGVNFSPLHAGIFAFESRLGNPLKQALARRLLDYPEMIGQSPLLDRALRDLAANTPASRLRLALFAPLGALYDATLRESDYAKLALWSWQDERRARAAPSPLMDGSSAPIIDWQARIDAAEAGYQRQPALTPYSTGPRTGFDDFRQGLFRDQRHPEVAPDANFARACAASKEWTDLDLLLRTASEMNVRLLLVCQPLNAPFTRLQGLTERSSALFYDRLQQAVKPYGVSLATFPEGESDPHFYRDCLHPSAKAWLIYDRALDAFFHAPGTAPLKGTAHENNFLDFPEACRTGRNRFARETTLYRSMNPQDPAPSNRPQNLYQMTQPERKGGGGGLLVLLLLALLLAGGGGYYYMTRKKAPVVAALPAAATPGVASSPVPTPTPHYNSVTEQSYIDQADNAFMAVQQPKAKAFTDALTAFKNAGYINAQGLTSKEALAARRDLIAKCIAANDDYAAFVPTQEAFFKDELAKTPLTPEDQKATFDQYVQKAKTADVIKLRQAQHDYLQACDDMMAALAKWEGNWSVTPAGKLVLKRKENIAEFNVLAQKCNVQAALVTQLQNDFNGTVEPGGVASPGAAASASASPAASPTAAAASTPVKQP